MPTKPPASSPTDVRRADRRLRHSGRLAGLLASIAAIVAGCKAPPAPAPAPPPTSGISPEAPTGESPAIPEGTSVASVATDRPGQAPVRPSGARTPREYRLDAANHLYGLNANRIYKGRLPPLLYAIGTLEVAVDRQGNVLSTHWLRAPRHAPEVVAEIERSVRQAAPYPAPERIGKVIYTDTWLWHRSGRFQLDTLTEGQD